MRGSHWPPTTVLPPDTLQTLYTCLSQYRIVSLDGKQIIGITRAEMLQVLLLLAQLPRAQKDLSRRELSKRNHRTGFSAGRRVGRRRVSARVQY